MPLKKGKYIEMKLNNQNEGKRKRKIENEKDAYLRGFFKWQCNKEN